MRKSCVTSSACGLAEETQNHAMQECTKIHSNNTNKVTPEKIFNDNITQLNQTAHIIQINTDLLETYNKPSRAPAKCGGLAQQPTQCRGGVTQRTGIPATN